MKQRKDPSPDSFLNRLLRDLRNTPSFRAGREVIGTEARDLLHAACLSYIRDRYGSFQEGSDAFGAAGLDYRKGILVAENASGSHQLVVTFAGGNAHIPDLEQYFTDSRGIYSSKGYYDERTVSRFNATVYRLLDEILGSR